MGEIRTKNGQKMEDFIKSIGSEIKKSTFSEFAKISTLLEGIDNRKNASSLLISAKINAESSQSIPASDAENATFEKIKDKITTVEGIAKLEKDLEDPEICGLYVSKSSHLKIKMR